LNFRDFKKKLLRGKAYYLFKVTERIRKKKMKKNHIIISLDQLKEDLASIGLKKGDIVLVHSSLSHIGYLDQGPITLFDAIESVIGSEGTVIIPTYSIPSNMLNTCLQKDYIFDPKTTPTTLGAIPSVFLKQPNVVRSLHPTNSLAARGKHKEYITNSHHLSDQTFGKMSPWAKLVELNGKILGIGIDLGPHTIYHYVEDILGDQFPINVKYDKKIDVKCIDYNGNPLKISVQPLDPKVALDRIDQLENKFIRDYFWQIYIYLGALNTHKIGLASSWLTDAKKFCVIVEELAKMGITIYSDKEDLKRKKLYPFSLLKPKLDTFITQ
jgi:aminoglycoside N3'-acetyltransferase